MTREKQPNVKSYPPAIRRICLFVFSLTIALTLGQGLMRFRHVLRATGEQFVALNANDALLHVTLAQRILDGQGYTNPPTSQDAHSGEPEPAFEKAPMYPYMLAGLFRITGIGFSFFLFQSLIGGFLSMLVTLVSWEAFGNPLAALFAGVGAAVNPILVNSASQLYNENIYFCLFFLCVWLYLRWYRGASLRLALLCGCCAGLTALMRESILVPFALLVLWTAIWGWRKNRVAALKSAVLMAAGLTAVVAPWTIRNYVLTGEFVPISIASVRLIGAGNNACVAAESWSTPFYGDNPCPSLNAQRAELLATQTSRGPQVVKEARAGAVLGERYILGHPGVYLKLCVRRAWTAFDPWHPEQHLAGLKKWVMLLYFLVFVVVGVVGVGWFATPDAPFQVKTLLLLLLAMYAPLVFVFVSHDHRFAVGIHLLLGCFGGAWLAHFRFAQGWFGASSQE